nr:MAG TPA: hypothetical protein [Caudoviricetes sp.]
MKCKFLVFCRYCFYRFDSSIQYFEKFNFSLRVILNIAF